MDGDERKAQHTKEKNCVRSRNGLIILQANQWPTDQKKEKACWKDDHPFSQAYHVGGVLEKIRLRKAC